MTHVTAADGTKLYVKTWGGGDGAPTLVLAHGWPLNADTFDDLGVGLAKHGWKVVAYDRRGFGRSDQPPTGYEYNTLADDFAAVIDACADGGKVAIGGFSMGGGEVARYLANHGASKVSHAILISSVVPYMLQTDDNPHGVPAGVFAEMTDGINDDRAGFMQDFAKQFYGVGFVTSPVSSAALDHFFAMAMMAGLQGTLDCAAAFASTDFRADCAAFTVPTLILHGTADKVVPIDTSARHAAQLIAHAQLIEYDGAPHGTLATSKAEILSDVAAFLNGTPMDVRHDQMIAGTEEPMFGGDPAGLQPAY